MSTKMKKPSASESLKEKSVSSALDKCLEAQAEGRALVQKAREQSKMLQEKLESVEALAKANGTTIDALLETVDFLTPTETTRFFELKEEFEQSTKETAPLPKVSNKSKEKSRKDTTRGTRNKWISVK